MLPFTDPAASDDGQYFGDGVAETLIYALNKVEGLRVAAQTSAFSFRGADVDLASIGEQLNVGTVLRGNVQRAGNRLRVTVRLESTTDGAQLWSEQYDRQEEDVFAIQDEIARGGRSVAGDAVGFERRTARAAGDGEPRGVQPLPSGPLRLGAAG